MNVRLMSSPAQETTADPRWSALVRRDPAADGTFVYSVKTTGVYCRPSCPARQPRPENVAFHDTCAQAEQAGFRACRRCRPGQSSLGLAEKLTRACRLLESLETPPALEALAKMIDLSPSHLHRSFKAATGLTPREYGAAQKESRLRQSLTEGDSVTGAIYAAGYGSSSRVYENADSLLGMSPTSYRGGGADTCIRFAVGECSLGAILVARSQRGLCAISLGDEPEALARELQDRFPRAEMVGDDEDFARLVARVVGFVETPGEGGLDLPLDIRGTAFQKRVWTALSQIPLGQTASYAEIAHRLGQPQSARAVAGACAANTLAVAIPCHRVVRQDGSLSGYRWGVERKAALLEREKVPG